VLAGVIVLWANKVRWLQLPSDSSRLHRTVLICLTASVEADTSSACGSSMLRCCGIGGSIQ